MDKKPARQTTGATLILRTLKISGWKAVSDDEGPVMSRKPMMTTAIPAASKIKFTLSKANFRLSDDIFIQFLGFLC